MDECRALNEIGPPERDLEEEPQRRDRLVEGGDAHAAGKCSDPMGSSAWAGRSTDFFPLAVVRVPQHKALGNMMFSRALCWGEFGRRYVSWKRLLESRGVDSAESRAMTIKFGKRPRMAR